MRTPPGELVVRARTERNPVATRPTVATASRAPTTLPAAMEGAVCLIVNPHAGAGRALKLLPGVEAELRGQGRVFRVERTTSIAPARELARDAAGRGEIVAAMGGDGIIGAIADELKHGRGLLAVLPGGRGNDFVRKLAIPFEPGEAAKLLHPGAERA